MLSRYGMSGERLAFDRATSERWKDEDGHLHVRVSNLSMATVNPYRGEEIPGYQELGLDPQRVYQLFRPPEELEKAAETFNNLRLLSKHAPVSATDPKEGLVAGSTGTDARFEHPFLRNSLVIWRQEDIDDVESRDKCALSCGYYYKPVMEPGTYQGKSYDGKMVDLRGNHVALVAAGRAGPDVLVHDSMENLMPQQQLSPRAVLMKGALIPYLKPKLLAGTVLALDAALGSVNGANWRTERVKVLNAITKEYGPKLAKDASLEDMHAFLDRLDGEESGAEDWAAMDDEVEAMDTEEVDEENEARKKEAEDKMPAKDRKAARDARRGARDAARSARDAKMSAKDKKARDAERAKDEDDDEEKRETKEIEAEDKAKDKKAMDSAISSAVTAATDKVRADLRAAAAAREAVRPLIGQVSIAMDSAEAIYKAALDHYKIDVSDAPPAAYAALVRTIKPAGERKAGPAMDAALSDDLSSRFPSIRQRATA